MAAATMAAATMDDETLYKQTFAKFLEQDYNHGMYHAKLETLISKRETRLLVNLNDLRVFDGEFVRSLLSTPFHVIPACHAALEDAISSMDAVFHAEFKGNLFVGFEGSFGGHHMTPRGVSARYLGKLVMVEGIVTRASLVRPKMVSSTHYCPATNKTFVRAYRDNTSLAGKPTTSAYPTKDDEGNMYETEFGLSSYKDHQTVGIQEMPERTPAGQLPRSIDVILDNDLVDSVKPGDRVQIVGIYRALAQKSGKSTSGLFKAVLLGNNVRQLGKEVQQPVITDKDLENIKRLIKSEGDGIFETLSESLAPSIWGHDAIKKAILCVMLGGIEKNLDNGAHLRGDINMLLVGDPSTAKSQVLRFVLNTAPLAIATTGRGASGVGLTAAVTTDEETGEKRLEAGAMVLADRGIVCIDEFDKMTDLDRVAIHEVMEQQTVTIAKAGIHTSLNARCSVVAAANPVYGQYNRHESVMKNINMPDSLLSRFDLLFIVLDNMEPDHDRDISEHVLRMHRYRRPGEPEGHVLATTQDTLTITDDIQRTEEGEETPMWEKHNAMLHGKRKKGARRRFLTIPFIKKFIHYVKARSKPTLSTDAAEVIAEAYSTLRSQEADKSLPITARTLETLIRISTAHAKVSMKREVSVDDAEAALGLLNFALFHDTTVQEKKKKKNKRRNVAEDSDSQDDDDDDDNNDSKETASRMNKRKEQRSNNSTTTNANEPEDEFDFVDDDSQEPVRKKSRKSSSRVTTAPSTSDKIPREIFMASVQDAFPRNEYLMPEDELRTKLMTELGVSANAITEGFEELKRENKIMIASGDVVLI